MNWLFCFVAVVLASFGGSAGAATLAVNDQGLLTGATDIDISGNSYGVDFFVGDFHSYFYAGSKYLFFPNDAQMVTAGQALLDQVLIDGPLGDFNSDPSMVFGCGETETADWCSMIVPQIARVTGQKSTGTYKFGSVFNASPESATLIHPSFTDKVGAGGVSVSVYPDGKVASTCEGAGCVWVGFYETPVEVPAIPLPASLPLIFAGLGGLAWIARRKKKQA